MAQKATTATINPDGSRTYSDFHRKMVTITVIAGSISTALSMTVINVAIPEIMGSFGIGQDKAQWLSAAFLAAMTSSMILVDWMLRTFGPRAVYVGSLILFTAGSVLGGMAPETNSLILARTLQGAGAGSIQPLAMLAIFRIYPPGERGKAMGIFGLGVMVAPALGPWIGGMTVDAFSWRLVFFLPLPFCGLAALLALFYLSPRDPNAPRTSFDWIGFVFLVTFTTSLLIGLSSGTREGWQSDIILSYLGVAVISFLAFVYWESNISNPILNMQLFLHPRFAAAAIVSFVFGLGFFGSFYLVPLFVQIIQGYTPTWSGLVLMPGSMLLLFMFPFMGRLTDMYEPNRLILIGLPLFGISSVLMAEASVDTPFWQFAWWLVISRMGIGLVFTPLTTASLRVLPPELLAQGSGTINFIRQLGGAFGVNLLAFTLDNRTAHHWQALRDTQTSGNPATAELLHKIRELLLRQGLPIRADALYEPNSLQYLDQVVAAQANAAAYRDGFLVVALIFFLTMIPAYYIRTPRQKVGGEVPRLRTH